ncbi:MAG: AAA family ATPase, partial [Peptococcaceae bacterium]|nr:AAA family ATPase [Peptococcaceae bacterium]
MERKIAKDLLTWKNKPDKLPLLLQGARQVGKTYTLLSFGKQYYKNVAYFSMEESREIP